MSDPDSTLAEEAEVIGACPGRCGRAIKRGVVIRDHGRVRALLHEMPSCKYFVDNDIDTILADSAKLPKA